MAYTYAQLTEFFTNANAGTGPNQAQQLALQGLLNDNQSGVSNDATFAKTVDLASDSTLAVSVGTYQFFLGYAPSQAGLTALNAAYVGSGAQAGLNGENRFIAQSVALALQNATAKANFTASYGSLSVEAATKAAYLIIIGQAAATANNVNVDASVAYLASASAQAYYTAFIKANVPGIAAADLALAVKAAIIGEILFQATSYNNGAGIGSYAQASTNLVKDLAADNVLTNDNVSGIDLLGKYGNTNGGGQSLVLTAGVDTITGTTGDDTITGLVDATAGAAPTLTALDSIAGGAGNDTLVINSITALGQANINGLTVTGVETVNLRGADAVVANVSAWTDVTALNVTQATSADVQAASTAAIGVSNVSGAIIANGGKSVTITDASAGSDITVGNIATTTGDISVTATNAGASSVAIDGGANVAVKVTGTTGGADSIVIGATKAATGAVTVTSGHTATAGTDVALDSIAVTGGKTVSIVQTADTSASAADTTGATLTQGAVAVTGNGSTTTVSVIQAASKAEVVSAAAIVAVTETGSVKFVAATAGQTIVVGGLTFTATGAMTAAEVASAFANLVANDTQGSGAAGKGTYTGTLAGFTSGAASGDTVVFSSTTAGNVGNLAVGGTAAPAVTVVDGVAAADAVTGVLGVTTGVVTIEDNATAAITSVTVDGYGNGSSIGSGTTLSKLANLSLSNSGGVNGVTTGTMTVDAVGVASLNLALNKVGGAVSLDGAGDNALKTLNVTTSGSNSTFALTAAAVETLTVAGDKTLNISTGTLSALKTATVTGSAGLNLGAAAATTLTSVNSTGTTGATTVSINGTLATFAGGAGTDSVTLVTGTALTKSIDLGAGNDTLTFTAAVTGSTTTLSGGDGTDTLALTFANADALDASKQSFITNFERLTLTNAPGNTNTTAENFTLDLDNLGFTTYVTTAGTVADGANSDTLVLNKLASGGTVVLTAAGLVNVGVTDAATGTADVVNVTLSSSGNLAAGTFTAANVETINITTVDTQSAPQTKNVDSLTLTAADATKVTVTGGQDLTLTLTGSTKVATIDASAVTGNFTVASLNTTTATTITGGTGNDSLTAATGTNAHTLIGGAGNDTLTTNSGLSTLTGGAGNDTFVIGATANANSYSTITDFSAGDTIQITGATTFTNAKVVLGDTAVFQDYANDAINTLAAGGSAWFQYAGNTYIVTDLGANTTTFTNAQDSIVKLTGLVDLTTASFNATGGTISL